MSFTFSAAVKTQLRELALASCPECDGEGVIAVVYNNNPDREEDEACACTRREGAEETVSGDAWDGGFAENH